jgi:hypothetical protein
MRNDILKRKSEIVNWIKSNQSKAFICEELSCKPSTLDSYLKFFGINYSGNRGGKGIKISNQRKSAIEYINSKSVIKSHFLKLKLIEDGIKKHECEKCKKKKWLNANIPLELHHIDGNRFNNKLENLKLLCPNCHALEPNNSGAAKKQNAPMEELAVSFVLEANAK